MSARVHEGRVEVRVSDGGPGVPAELVPRLFDRFATAGTTSGTGLGLHLVREIMKGHGGEATYEPPGRGTPTSLVIRFPADAATQ